MIVQNIHTKRHYKLFAFRPDKLIILIDGKQTTVDDADYTLEIDPSLYCLCENRKEQPRINCPADSSDECNCCLHCQLTCK